MQPAGIGIGWPWIAGLALLALAGLFVIWRGLYPRRQGTTPYCRKCGYNLTGTERTGEDARCSECGSHVTDDAAVVFGERIRRWRRMFAGLVIFLLGTAPLVLIGIGVARSIDWYRYKPTAWVLRDLHSTNTGVASRAASEVTRRLRVEELSSAKIEQLAEACLAEQERANPRRGGRSELIDLLGMLYERDLLSPNEVDRFFENLCTVKLSVRPVVICGRWYAIELILEGRTPSSGPWVDARLHEMRVGDQVIADGSVCRDTLLGTPSISSTTYHLRPSTSGRHQLTAGIGLEVRAGDVRYPDQAETLRIMRRTLTAQLTVLEEESPEYIALRRSPELDATIERSVRPRDLRIRSAQKQNAPHWLEYYIEFDEQLPIGLAFRLYIEFGAQVLDQDFIYARPGRDTTQTSYRGIELSGAPPKTINIILKASKEAAEGTVDLFEIWGGELRFENVPVEQRPESQPTAPGLRIP